MISPDAPPQRLGPYGDLQIRLWERPGIDDESVYGAPDDLRRLAQLVESRLADTGPGEEVVIGREYAGDAECSLVFEIMDDDFDPAAAVASVSVEDPAPAPAAASPRVAFKFHSPDGRECDGLVRLEGADLVIQYERKDLAAKVAKIRDAFFGTIRLNFRRADRDSAANLATAIDASHAEARWQ